MLSGVQPLVRSRGAPQEGARWFPQVPGVQQSESMLPPVAHWGHLRPGTFGLWRRPSMNCLLTPFVRFPGIPGPA